MYWNVGYWILGRGSTVLIDFIIIGGLLLAAVDLLSTFIFDKPLIGPGPIAKAMYPGLEEDNGEE